MHIRELELSGFKSFVAKTRLEFTPGLTAVIGPNGSGKSNLVDAIRWVLGEHNSRLLRATRMEEVIFNGSKRLKPVGRAEVSLTIDNFDGELPIDYREIRLTRRLYRSGEAEYLLNNAPCRLRDIQQLLWDTGVGKRGFAVVGQGQVEELLAASPEERRGFLDEVAGIVRYDSRRREAGQKLAETEAHLQRLVDIISEQKAQLGSLEQEVAVARKYQALQEEITSYQQQLDFRRLAAMEQRCRQLEERLSLLCEKLGQQEEQRALLEAGLAEARRRLTDVDSRRKTVQAEKSRVAEARRGAEVKLEAATREASFLENEEQRLTQELEEVRASRRQLEEEMGRCAAELTELGVRRRTVEAECREAVESLQASDEEFRVVNRLREERRAEVYNLWQDLLATQNRLRALDGEWQLERARGQRLYAERQRLNEEKTGVDGELVRAGQRVSASRALLEEIEENLARLKAEMDELNRELATLRKVSAKLLQQWQQDRNRLSVLREWQQARDGYNDGVRAMVRAERELWPEDNGIIGIVAELIKVPKELEIAVEVALGGALQYIVARSESDVRRAIAYLKASGSGRATFLPLEAIQPRRLSVDRSVLKWAGIIGVASELVEAPKECAAILPHLLGDLLVVTKLDLALMVARRLGYRARMVTLEGDLLRPGGAVTGGSARGRSGGLLAKLREINELSSRVEAGAGELAACREKEFYLKSRLESREGKLRRLQEQLWKQKAEVNREEAEQQELARRRAKLQEQLTVACLETDRWEKDFKALTSERSRLENAFAELQRIQEGFAAREEEPEDHYRALEEKRAKSLAAVEESRRRLADLQQQEERLRGTLTGLEQLQARYDSEIAQLEARLVDVTARLRKVSASRYELQQLVAELDREEQELASRLATAETSCSAAQAVLIEKERELSQVGARTQSLEKDYLQVQQAIGEQLAERRFLMDRLRERYGWQVEEGIPPLTVGQQELETLLEARQQELEQLGPVDTGILAEYRRLQERFGYLTQQAQDLQEARASLNRVVAEVEKLMEERLAQALVDVNRQLEEVCPVLFGGGKVWLAPTGNGQLLGGGLDLVVQLPGKRVPTLALLSGGERALAAIAVIFALLQVKPSPFCILDEIDASLDEANVERFARFLRKMASKQQFIVVSHRAGTVEQAENVYGITMEDEGVSRLVSLRLPDAGEDRSWRESTG